MAKPKQQAEPTEAESLATALGLNFKSVTVRGEEVRVEEFEIEQLPQLLNLLKGLMSGGQAITERLLSQSGEIGIQMAMLATGKPRDWFKRMPLGDGLALYAAVIEVNQSFFTQSENFVSLFQFVNGLVGEATPATGIVSSASSSGAGLELIKSPA